MALDLRGYVDLTLYDRTIPQLVATARDVMQARIPGLQLREGMTEAVLIEAIAAVVFELVVAVNRTPGALAEVLFRLYDVERDVGAPPTVGVTVTVADAAGYTIPAGTRFRLDLPDGGDPVVFTLDGELVVATGQTSNTTPTPATGNRNTAEANGVPAGEPLAALSSIAYLEGAVTADVVTDGRAQETTAEWRDRAVLRIRRLVETLVIPDHFTAAALERPEVGRAFTVDLYDPGQAGVPGDHAGYVTLYVFGADGALLDSDERAAIDVALSAQAQANLGIIVADPVVTTVTVDADVVPRSGVDPVELETTVLDALEAYLDPLAWPWGGVVYVNELVALIDTIEGVDRVEVGTVLIDGVASDLELPGVANLVAFDRPGSTVTVL